MAGFLFKGFYYLKGSVLLGSAVYFCILLILYVTKRRRTYTWRRVLEWALSIYSVALLKITGIFSLSLSLEGFKNINLIPFVGGSASMMFLNFLLFVPLGFFLPMIFPSCRNNAKKVVLIGGSISFAIEMLQMFGGRYAEIDDFIINTAGAFAGYVLASCVTGWKENRKKAWISLGVLCAVFAVCFTGIYLISDRETELPTGLDAAADNIAEICVYAHGERQTMDRDADTYSMLSMQLSNCSGLILQPQDVSEKEIWSDTDCFIEILYTTPQTIVFENAESFAITDADRLLYNATRNILFWGKGQYQYSVDYTHFDSELQPHREKILEQYQQLETSIEEQFG